MKNANVFVDVDLTLVDANGKPLEGARDALRALKNAGCHLFLWSTVGPDYCRKVAEFHRLTDLFEGFTAKPERRLNMGGPLQAYEDELPVLYTAGVRAVVCLLNIPSDAAVYESAGFAFKCLPVPDGGAPTMEQAQEFIDFVNRQLAQHRPVAVHCEGGLGQTGTMLATHLISQGDSAEIAIRRVRVAESSAVETPQQIRFLEQFAALRDSPETGA